jgi:transcriptional regulator with XRE-family HTH domain
MSLMGRGIRQRPARLAKKLAHIRAALGLSQNEMISRLGLSDELMREEISAFELGKRQPHLQVLLRYARCIGISTDVLIDDELDLPAKLLQSARREVARGRPASRPGRKR